MNTHREIAYRIDPALWMREVLGMAPRPWQEKFLCAPRGASMLALTARQVGKTTAAAVGMAHSAMFMPGSLSVVACPTQQQSAEAVRKVREMVLKAGATLVSDNVYALELANGSRVKALPGSDDSVRGLTVDAWIVADEAARLTPELIAALRPMRAQRPHARFVMLSTAWSRTDPFWTAWASDDPSWLRFQVTVDLDPTLYDAAYLAKERRALGEAAYKREFLGIPAAGQVSPFEWQLYERATQTSLHRNVWEFCRPFIIAHDVGRTKDRSTAVVGGNSPLAPEVVNLKDFNELPQGLYASARAEALAAVDRLYDSRTLIVADLSNDASYAEVLFERFGSRVIGVHITRSGDGETPEHRPVKGGHVPVYTVGRTQLFDLLLRELHDDMIRIRNGPQSVRAFEQLTNLEMEFKQSGTIYNCPSGHHDDLAISCAMLVWAARHRHLSYWTRVLEPRPARVRRPAPSALAWT